MNGPPNPAGNSNHACDPCGVDAYASRSSLPWFCVDSRVVNNTFKRYWQYQYTLKNVLPIPIQISKKDCNTNTFLVLLKQYLDLKKLY